MKIRISNESGSVLGTCLCTVAIMGITLAAYLDLVSAQNTSIARSPSVAIKTRPTSHPCSEMTRLIR